MDTPPSPDNVATSGRIRRAVRQRLRTHGALVFAVAVVLTDFGFRLGAVGYENPTRWGLKDAALYTLGIVWSFGTWSLYANVVSRFSSRPKVVGAIRAVTAITIAVLFSLSFAYLRAFDQAPSWQVLKFVAAEPKWLIRLGSWGLTWQDALAVLATGVVAWWLLAPVERPKVEVPSARWRRLMRAVRQMVYLVLTGLVLIAPGFQSPLPVDANAAAAIAQYALTQATSSRHLVAPVRPPLNKPPSAPRPNILVLVHESLRADVVFDGMDYANTTLDAKKLSPYQSTLASRRADGFFVFPFARTNSTATESSVPSILSGVDPGGPADAYGRAHSLWSVGKATGAHTFLFAAEAYSWCHFDEYFIDGNVDRALTGTELSSAVPIGSTAADDGAVADEAIRHFESLAASRERFVGAIHFDGTHLPGWAGPGTPAFAGPPGDTERYGMAVQYIDGLVARIMQALERLGLDATTVVLATSDHGENIIPRRQPDRLGAYYEPTVRIPFWIRVPPAVLAANPEWATALDAWHLGNVQNLDVLPTVRDLLSLGDQPLLQPPNLVGRSLVGPVPETDKIAGQSTCAIREWALEGFFLVVGRTKVIVSNDQPTAQVYDLRNDPLEQNNLWKDPTWQARATQWIEQSLAAGGDRLALCGRMPDVCPSGN